MINFKFDMIHLGGNEIDAFSILASPNRMLVLHSHPLMDGVKVLLLFQSVIRALLFCYSCFLLHVCGRRCWTHHLSYIYSIEHPIRRLDDGNRRQTRWNKKCRWPQSGFGHDKKRSELIMTALTAVRMVSENIRYGTEYQGRYEGISYILMPFGCTFLCHSRLESGSSFAVQPEW